MKILTALLALFTVLVSCASTANVNRPSIEAEDINYITSKASKSITECLDFNNQKACDVTNEYLEKYPWLLTRQVRITNFKGMRQAEWDSQIISIKKSLNLIKDRYPEFEKKN